MTAPGPGPDLTGRSVLLPRSPDRAAGLARRLRDAGADVTVAPVIERAPALDQHALRDAVDRLRDGRYAWTVITSVNAVDALAGALPGSDAGTPATQAALAAAPTRWAAVGPATVRALRSVGIEPELVPTDASAAGLVAAFPGPSEGTASPTPHRVLLPLGDRARPSLRDGLTRLGWTPEVVTAYRTVRSELPADVVAHAYDLVVVTSGSVAREVADQLGTAAPVVAIGRPSAEVAGEVGLTVAGVASAPTDDGLAAAVTTALEQNP
ncbi:uroporphyrinogen-III synthase [Isoptericola sp. AK164]|uniref:uroporphyrinogen-III synthase n=1 Tax=Isoptericola sp. AK164 TaxID=3024246 RepID=UPI002418B6C3|nr:uroporphyrinogen-III synthase [Isoptericola sp. AK164]